MKKSGGRKTPIFFCPHRSHSSQNLMGTLETPHRPLQAPSALDFKAEGGVDVACENGGKIVVPKSCTTWLELGFPRRPRPRPLHHVLSLDCLAYLARSLTWRRLRRSHYLLSYYPVPCHCCRRVARRDSGVEWCEIRHVFLMKYCLVVTISTVLAVMVRPQSTSPPMYKLHRVLCAKPSIQLQLLRCSCVPMNPLQYTGFRIQILRQ